MDNDLLMDSDCERTYNEFCRGIVFDDATNGELAMIDGKDVLEGGEGGDGTMKMPSIPVESTTDGKAGPVSESDSSDALSHHDSTGLIPAPKLKKRRFPERTRQFGMICPEGEVLRDSKVAKLCRKEDIAKVTHLTISSGEQAWMFWRSKPWSKARCSKFMSELGAEFVFFNVGKTKHAKIESRFKQADEQAQIQRNMVDLTLTVAKDLSIPKVQAREAPTLVVPRECTPCEVLTDLVRNNTYDLGTIEKIVSSELHTYPRFHAMMSMDSDKMARFSLKFESKVLGILVGVCSPDPSVQYTGLDASFLTTQNKDTMGEILSQRVQECILRKTTALVVQNPMVNHSKFLVPAMVQMMYATARAADNKWGGDKKQRFMETTFHILAMDHSMLVGWIMALEDLSKHILTIYPEWGSELQEYGEDQINMVVHPELRASVGKDYNINAIQTYMASVRINIERALISARQLDFTLFTEYLKSPTGVKWRSSLCA